MSDHYIQAKSGNYFLHVIRLYALFHLAFIITGGILYYRKTGFSTVRIYESVRGSEETLQFFPGSEDHFVNPATPRGLLKVALPHFLAFALVLFIAIHLLTSLGANRSFLQYFTVFAFFVAFLEMFFSLLLLLGPDWLVYIRLPVFFLFLLSQSWLAGMFFLPVAANNH